MSEITKSGIVLTRGPNDKRGGGRVHDELHAPCGCAFHERPAPHWHPCPSHAPGGEPRVLINGTNLTRLRMEVGKGYTPSAAMVLDLIDAVMRANADMPKMHADGLPIPNEITEAVVKIRRFCKANRLHIDLNTGSVLTSAEIAKFAKAIAAGGN